MTGKLTFKLCQLTISDQGSDLKTPSLVEITNLGFLIAKLNPLRILGKNVPHSAIIKLGEVLSSNSASTPGGAQGVVGGVVSQNKVRFKDCYLTLAEQVSDPNALAGEIIDLGFLITKFDPLEMTGTHISRSTLRKLGKVLSKHCISKTGGASGVVGECDSQKDRAARVKKPAPTPNSTPQHDIGQLNLDDTLIKGSASSRKYDESRMRPQFYVGPKTRLKIHVRKIDITRVDADAIVSSADRRLHHICGVAKAIASAAGPSLVSECESHRRTHERLDVTDVFVSAGGLLKAKYVLHAVGPKFEACTDKKLSTDLRRTVVRCLVEASRLQCETIALPSICSVAVLLTTNQIAQCYMEAVKSFDDFAEKLGVAPVKNVWFVDINEIMVDAIQKQFMNEWDRPVDTAVSREDFQFAQQHVAKRNGQSDSAAVQDKYQQSLPQRTKQGGRSHQIIPQADVTTGVIPPPSVATHAKGFQDDREKSTYKVTPQIPEKHSTGGTDRTEGSYKPATQQNKGIRPGNQASGQYIPIVVQGNTGSGLDYHSYSGSQQDIGYLESHQRAQLFNSQPFNRDLENKDFEIGNLPDVQRGNLPDVQRGNLPDVQRGNLPDVQRGNLPDVDMSCFLGRMDVSGYTGKGTIEITYKIGGGRNHSSPGKSFPSIERSAYLPATEEGFEALRLLRIAFLRRLIFKVDASNPAGIAWNIQHKTSLTNSPHGYPDPTYLTRLMQELKDNGVRLKSMSEEEENLSLDFVERVMKTKIIRH